MTYYQQTAADMSRRLSVLRSRNRLFIISEILTFALFITAVILFANGTMQTVMVLAAIVMIGVYVGIRRVDTLTDKEISRLEDVVSVCRRELDYQQGRLDGFDDGARYVNPSHPFTIDLDVFGKGSLYQRICRAVTSGGADALAGALELNDGIHDERKDAIKKLSEDEELLTGFKRFGQRGVADTTSVRRAFGKVGEIALPWWVKSKFVRIAGMTYTTVFLCALLASVVLQEHLLAMVWWCIFNFFVIYSVCNKSMKAMTGAVGGLVKELGAYVQLVRIIETNDIDEPVLNGLRGRVRGCK